MESSEHQYRTPKSKLFKNSPSFKFFSSSRRMGTPQAKFMRFDTPGSMSKRGPSSLHLFPVLSTPPSHFPKVKNPFEPGLTERLHLPLICSPSLFQRPSTPQHSSTQFEWTIEDVSSLGPANVEAHETQFHATPDPDLEARAQAAISSYFKEQLIVPSPVDCPLRSQKIPFVEETGHSPAVRPGRRIRDGISQTVLTFPPSLPQEVEAILSKYFIYTADQQQSPSIDCDTTIDYEARDASLRRKLFETSPNSSCAGDWEVDELPECKVGSPPPRTPDLLQNTMPLGSCQFGSHGSSDRGRMSSLNISLSPVAKNSFGSLSPISKLDSFSEHQIETEPKTPTDTHPLTPVQSRATATLRKSAMDVSLFRSTPDRATPPVEGHSEHMSLDSSFNGRIGRLIANCSRVIIDSAKLKTSNDAVFFSDDDDNDNMQVSQLSAKSTSSSGSSQHPDTPMRRRRSANRKNLSQSFSCHLTDDDDGSGDEKENTINSTKFGPKLFDSGLKPKDGSVGCSVFYRTDSGFNDMTSTTQNESKVTTQESKALIEIKRNPLCERRQSLSPDLCVDVSMNGDVSMMICCSTPSSKFGNYF